MKPQFSPVAHKPSDAFRPNSTSAVIVSGVDTNMPAIATSAMVRRLTPNDQSVVLGLRQSLSKRDPNVLTNYGAAIPAEMSKMADTLLEHAKASDISFVGTKMTEVIAKAKGINVSALNGNKSHVPFIGKYIDEFKNSRAKVTGRFDVVCKQIEHTVAEVDTFCAGITKRQIALEELYQANLREYHQLHLHIVAAKLHHEETQAEMESFAASLTAGADPFDVQQLADAKRYLTNLGITISNLERQEMSAVQFAPQTRLVQQGGAQLLDKFGMVKTFTIPSWKKKFALALTIEENKQGAALANLIDDANNEFARDTATALKQTSIDVAKANQRGVYDIETIEFVQAELISGVDEVVKITTQGDKDRETVSARLAQMKQELQLKLS